MTRDHFQDNSKVKDKTQKDGASTATANVIQVQARPAPPAPPGPRPPAPKPPFGMPAMPVAMNVRILPAVLKTCTTDTAPDQEGTTDDK